MRDKRHRHRPAAENCRTIPRAEALGVVQPRRFQANLGILDPIPHA
jgi:hypothetical protein